MNIRSPYANRPSVTPESKFEPSRVETTGYIPAKQKIESLLRAGRLLMDSRSNYDTEDENVIPELDPTRRKDFDLADGSRLLNETTNRLKSRLKPKKSTDGAEKPVVEASKPSPEVNDKPK